MDGGGRDGRGDGGVHESLSSQPLALTKHEF